VPATARLALLRLRAGDADGYRRLCAGLLDRVADSGTAAEVEQALWVCSLGEPAEADRERLSRLAERAAEGAGDRAALAAAAAALNRLGRVAEARRLLDRLGPQRREQWELNWGLLRAMVLWRDGDAEGAREWLRA